LGKKKNYVDNATFLKLLANYKKSKKKAVKNNLPIPSIPDEIGVIILDIANGLARRPNFSGYSFKEEMISDGIENCLNYLDNFDPKISSNPFSYFTQIVFFAFLRRIQFESKQTYVKFKSFEHHELFTNHEYERKKHVDLVKTIINENTQSIISKFEEKMGNKKTTTEEPPIEINLGLLME
jgi:hypothetical protein